jgi:simple sugar transport system ATP-binding protein
LDLLQEVIMPPGVEIRNISKRFGRVTALDDVSLTLQSGRVHGLLGENGAGKSTLMNILYGLTRADAGTIRIDGRAADLRSPRDALANGVGMVQQHFALADAMTVLDNVLLGDRRTRAWLDRSAARKELSELSNSIGLPVNPDARIEALSLGERQRVEILKALTRDVHVLILDEPTAVLTPGEVEPLFTAIKRLRDQGRSVVFISHKLGEIRDLCDEVTVLRAGRLVFEGNADAVSPEELARHMVGRDVPLAKRTDNIQPAADTLLDLRDVGFGRLTNVSLTIRAGEILGVAGVDGNGQQELSEAVAGISKPDQGTINLAGRDITQLSASQRFADGIAHIPNDRKTEGLIPTMSIAENIGLKHVHGPFLQTGCMRRTARELIDRFEIRAPSETVAVSTLSGGNAQKVVLARELGVKLPRVVLAVNPARGLDVGATNFVYEQLLAARAAGGAVLLISAELEELLRLCDRIGVLYNGRFTMSDFPRQGVEEIGRLMTGAAA